MNLAKRKANNSSTGVKFVITNDIETEDLNYQIQWIKVVIQGTPEQELEEYNEAQAMYQPFGKIMKKELPSDERMKRFFKTKMLSSTQVEEAYKSGYGSVSDNNIANKLLEMGILTHIEKIDDYQNRGV
jgi:hypothetical protein